MAKFSDVHDADDHSGVSGYGDLLDETAHDALDHTGLTGVGGGPEVTVAVLGSHSQVSSTSFANSGLSFAVEASSRYLIEFFLDTDTNATTVGIKLALNAAEAGTAIMLSGFVPTAAPANASAWAGGVTFTKDGQPFAVTSGSGPTRASVYLYGWVITTTNPDTVHLRHASETATQTNIYAGSVGRMTKLA